MTLHILAMYDRSPLGGLAVETAFQFACSKDGASVLHVLAIPATPSDAEERETLDDDLIAFAQVGRRLGVAVDGAIVDSPDTERIVAEIQRRQIDHLVVTGSAGQNGGTTMSRMLDAAAKATGIATIAVHDEAENRETTR